MAEPPKDWVRSDKCLVEGMSLSKNLKRQVSLTNALRSPKLTTKPWLANGRTLVTQTSLSISTLSMLLIKNHTIKTEGKITTWKCAGYSAYPKSLHLMIRRVKKAKKTFQKKSLKKLLLKLSAKVDQNAQTVQQQRMKRQNSCINFSRKWARCVWKTRGLKSCSTSTFLLIFAKIISSEERMVIRLKFN